jgi:hypothetical protein
MLTNLFNVSCVAQLVRALAFACAQCVDGTSSTPRRVASTPRLTPCAFVSFAIARISRALRVLFARVVACHFCMSCVVRALSRTSPRAIRVCHALFARVVRVDASFAHRSRISHVLFRVSRAVSTRYLTVRL